MNHWVVVGGGSAGCVIAARLAARGIAVTLVEQGPAHRAAEGMDDGPLVGDPARLVAGLSVRRTGWAAPSLYLQGFGLGGSSLVNAGVVVQPDRASRQHLLPLEAPWAFGPVARATLAASPHAAPVALVRRNRRRVTTAEAYLDPSVRSQNLSVLTDTRVERIVCVGDRVVGVVAEGGAEIPADRVVVCAGAIATPALLLVSGVVAPQLGEGLQDHPAVTLAAPLLERPTDAPAISVTVERPDHQIVAMEHVGDAGGAGTLGALVVGITNVVSRGRVVVRDGRPSVEIGALGSRRELDDLIAATVEAYGLAMASPMREVLGEVSLDEFGTRAADLVPDADRLGAWLRRSVGGHYHVAATCRIGVTTHTDGAVVGYHGLYVGDASLFPSVPARNPYLSVIVQAERLVNRWAAVGLA